MNQTEIKSCISIQHKKDTDLFLTPSEKESLFAKRKRHKTGLPKGYISQLKTQMSLLENRLRENLYRFPPEKRQDCIELLKKGCHNGTWDCDLASQPERLSESKILNTLKPKGGHNFVIASSKTMKVYMGESSTPFALLNCMGSGKKVFEVPQMGKTRLLGYQIQSIESRLTKNVLEFLINSYIKTFHDYFPIIDHNFLKSKIPASKNYDKSKLYCQKLPPVLLYSVLSAAYMEYHEKLNIENVEINRLCCDCYEKVSEMAFEISNQPSIQNLQSLLLHIVAPNPRNRLMVWQHMGSAVNMAYFLNIHTKPLPSKNIETQIRQNLWWGCYVADKVLSLMFGRPSMIKKSSYTIAPLGVSTFYQNNVNFHEARQSCLNSVYFVKFSQISVFINDILEKLYLIKQKNLKYQDVYDSSMEINLSLESWKCDFEPFYSIAKSDHELCKKLDVVYVYFLTCKVLLYKKLFSFSSSIELRKNYLEKMETFSDKGLALMKERENHFINHGVLLKAYPLFLFLSVFISKTYIVDQRSPKFDSYKEKIIEVLKILHKYNPQSYYYRIYVYRVIELLKENGISLSESLLLKYKEADISDLIILMENRIDMIKDC